MRVWVRGGVYFLLVFAVGFALGVVRVLWLVPRLGERSAELLEAPFMVAASFLAARFVVGRLPGETRAEHLRSGVVAIALLLSVEFTVVLGLRGVSLPEYVASRDPVAGAVYGGSLLAFALMPWLVAGRPGAARA